MSPEVHIVLIWEKGLNKFDDILYDLKILFRLLMLDGLIGVRIFFPTT